MKVIALTLALITGGLAAASTANAGWTGRQIGGATYWNHSSGNTVVCRRIGGATYCS
jgi:hypothetical protein